MNAWRIRENILDVMEQTTGGRIIQGSCKVGGVRRDISNEKLDEMVKDLDRIDRDMKALTTVFLQDDSIRHRLRNIGVLSREDAYHLGAVGPTARGSGVAIDARKLGYGAYDRLNFHAITDKLRGLSLTLYRQGKGALHLHGSDTAGSKKDPRRAHRCEGGRSAGRGILHAGRAAPGRTGSLPQG